MFDQNYQFDEIAQLRRSGVRTIGRFVWEHFSAEHVEPALEAFDRIYSLTACELERYARDGDRDAAGAVGMLPGARGAGSRKLRGRPRSRTWRHPGREPDAKRRICRW